MCAAKQQQKTYDVLRCAYLRQSQTVSDCCYGCLMYMRNLPSLAVHDSYQGEVSDRSHSAMEACLSLSLLSHLILTCFTEMKVRKNHKRFTPGYPPRLSNLSCRHQPDLTIASGIEPDAGAVSRLLAELCRIVVKLDRQANPPQLCYGNTSYHGSWTPHGFIW